MWHYEFTTEMMMQKPIQFLWAAFTITTAIFRDLKWEKVTYRDGKDNGVIDFIANNTDRRLKAVFLGKEYYYIILEDYDKIAVKDALALSKALKKRT